jgi:hypothetical protein
MGKGKEKNRLPVIVSDIYRLSPVTCFYCTLPGKWTILSRITLYQHRNKEKISKETGDVS